MGYVLQVKIKFLKMSRYFTKAIERLALNWLPLISLSATIPSVYSFFIFRMEGSVPQVTVHKCTSYLKGKISLEIHLHILSSFMFRSVILCAVSESSVYLWHHILNHFFFLPLETTDLLLCGNFLKIWFSFSA